MKKEYLCLSGFLGAGNEDDSLKYKLEVPLHCQTAILSIMGWKTLDDTHGNVWELNPEQVTKISEVIGQPLPAALDLYIEALAGS